MDTKPLWESLIENRKTYPQLKADIQADAAIIGGGITGITAALELLTP